MLPKSILEHTAVISHPVRKIAFMSVQIAPLRYLWRTLPFPRAFRRTVDRYYLYPRLKHISRVTTERMGSPSIVGFLQSGLGIGEAARQEALALCQAGLALGLRDISHLQGMKDLEDPVYADTDDFPAAGPLLIHANASETGMILRSLPAHLTRGRPIIGFWAWELAEPPLNWWRAYRYLSELWVPSEFVAEVFRPTCPVPLKVVPHPVQLPATMQLGRNDFGLSEKPCIFLCMADCRSDLVRKNISGCITAFKEAFGASEDVLLLVKLHHAAFVGRAVEELRREIGAARNILVETSLLSRAATGDLIRASDVFVSLHRSEGFGLPMAEAMLLGKPVIATAYSGNLTFMNSEVACLIDYSLTQVRAQRRPYAELKGAVWADPDLKQAAQAMTEMFASPERRRTQGELGRRHALRALSPVALLEAFIPWLSISPARPTEAFSREHGCEREGEPS
ncbi:MAG: hypothetical protein DRH08_08160 [Deltaproteobacteria bacterium]|nr:MAG: hypothetical protein DRH08_08160 [Deltaproteobacteria bacterium]